MPTGAEFEIAAERFTGAAGLIHELASKLNSFDATQVLRGGSLGRQVPEQLRRVASSAMVCYQQVSEASEVCLQRAGVIADYETLLQRYEAALTGFQADSRTYAANHAAWFLDETGTVPHPGEPPTRPEKPDPPPDWADVRRP